MTVNAMKKKAMEQLTLAAYNAENERLQGNTEYAEGLARDYDAYEEAFTCILGLLTMQEAEGAKTKGYETAAQMYKKYK